MTAENTKNTRFEEIFGEEAAERVAALATDVIESVGEVALGMIDAANKAIDNVAEQLNLDMEAADYEEEASEMTPSEELSSWQLVNDAESLLMAMPPEFGDYLADRLSERDNEDSDGEARALVREARPLIASQVSEVTDDSEQLIGNIKIEDGTDAERAVRFITARYQGDGEYILRAASNDGQTLHEVHTGDLGQFEVEDGEVILSVLRAIAKNKEDQLL